MDLKNRLDVDVAENALDHIRIARRPFSRALQRFELGDDQAASEAGGPRVGAIDSRMRTGENHAPLIDQGLQILEVPRPNTWTQTDAVWNVAREDRVQHQLPLPPSAPRSVAREEIQSACPTAINTDKPIMPQVLKYTQICSSKWYIT